MDELPPIENPVIHNEVWARIDFALSISQLLFVTDTANIPHKVVVSVEVNTTRSASYPRCDLYIGPNAWAVVHQAVDEDSAYTVFRTASGHLALYV